MIHDAPMNPVDTAVFWIEYTIRHNGTKELRYKGLKIPMWQYYLLDVFAITIFFIIILTLVAYQLFKQFLKLFKNKQESVKIKQN